MVPWEVYHSGFTVLWNPFSNVELMIATVLKMDHHSLELYGAALDAELKRAER